MLDTLKSKINECDILIMSAAIADYKVEEISKQKIKKNYDILNLKLIKNPDILMELSKYKKPNQVFVGFAAETEDLKNNALKKLKKKNLDMIVANDVSRKDIAFDSDFNEVQIFLQNEDVISLGKMRKKDLSEKILEIAVSIYKRKNA
jgi:phosphopantothenoylcysteine decarboxylase/phosphopantothenate--cysteine ligase